MPKGYWIASVTITDAARYAGYQRHAPAAFAKYGAKFLARGGDAQTLEGAEFERHVVIEFGSKEDALACYHSAEYRTARDRRAGACEARIVIVEGL
ncbi:DUF1330 domain-containing protein [Hasllibacter sp. MH4015]|uniref:DUF1330 domain-containing protein n=1 Tax=Hasllibacter sp. MH4015 TaxID=2854029 RepID=UPI001CD79515|nr:DUF1330 domain-containing protein [Hasllibacter sp. MH4015]